MEAVLEHLRAHAVGYVACAVCVLPLLVIFRRYAFPVLFYVVEFLVYCALMHTAVHCTALLAGWFKDQSTMKRAQGLQGQSFNPGWTTPWLEFWKRNLYEPHWLLYLELVAVGGIVFLMWRYRPFRIQTRGRRAAPPKKKPTRAYNYGNRRGGS